MSEGRNAPHALRRWAAAVSHLALRLDHARLRPLGQLDGVGERDRAILRREAEGGQQRSQHDQRHAVHAIPGLRVDRGR